MPSYCWASTSWAAIAASNCAFRPLPAALAAALSSAESLQLGRVLPHEDDADIGQNQDVRVARHCHEAILERYIRQHVEHVFGAGSNF